MVKASVSFELQRGLGYHVDELVIVAGSETDSLNKAAKYERGGAIHWIASCPSDSLHDLFACIEYCKKLAADPKHPNVPQELSLKRVVLLPTFVSKVTPSDWDVIKQCLGPEVEVEPHSQPQPVAVLLHSPQSFLPETQPLQAGAPATQ